MSLIAIQHSEIVDKDSFAEFYVQIRDFLNTTKLLPFGRIGERVVSVRHPGDGKPVRSLISTLNVLSYADRVLLLKHVLLNDMFHVTAFGIYDWGYWTDTAGVESVIPYGCHYLDPNHQKMTEPYTLYGVKPSISVIGSTYRSPDLNDARDEIVSSINDYVKNISQKATSDVVKWNAFDRVLHNAVRNLLTCIT